MLGKQFTRGRTKDQTLEKQLNSFEPKNGKENGNKNGKIDEDRVNLQYLDKKGRKLTLKEAFRQMCWKFHGMGPSHRKKEKMAKKEEIANKVSMASNSLGSLSTGVSSA